MNIGRVSTISARTIVFGSVTYPGILSLSKGAPRLVEYLYAPVCP